MVMTVSQAQRQLEEMLKQCSGDDSAYEAREIIRELIPSARPESEVTNEQYSACLDMVRRRQSGEPLQYIFGHWEFYGYDFEVGRGVLIPRPETELLCELAIKQLKRTGGKFADLCSGSGCIAVTVSKQTGLCGTAVELSDKAYGWLLKNIEKNDVADKITAVKGDIFDTDVINQFPNDSLDAVLSNPPYINSADMKVLQKEVRFEPEAALFGGEDGLDYYRRIFKLYKYKLRKGGLFAVEIGEEQGAAVSALMAQEGFTPAVIKDYSGQDRIVYAVNE